MAISAGNPILASDIYARQGIVAIKEGGSKKAGINIKSDQTYMMICQMATTGNGGGICLIYYDSGWKAQWVYDKPTATVSDKMTITFSTSGSNHAMTITNLSTGVHLRCLIFATSPSAWSVNLNTQYTTDGVRTDITAAQPGDKIYPINLTNSRHHKDIAVGSTYTIALANYLETPIFYFAKMGSNAYHQTGFIYYTSSGWQHKVLEQGSANNPTITISGTNCSITANGLLCRFSWYQVM